MLTIFGSHGLNSHADICTCVSLETLYKDTYSGRERTYIFLWLHAFISQSLRFVVVFFFCISFSCCCCCCLLPLLCTHFTFWFFVFLCLFIVSIQFCTVCATSLHYINIYSIARSFSMFILMLMVCMSLCMSLWPCLCRDPCTRSIYRFA